MEKFWLAIHIFGVVFGAGSVTTAYAREIYFKKHPELIAKRGSLPVITPMINIAFALVILSGIGLYLPNATELNKNPAFLIKMGLVLLLLVNHIFHTALRSKRDQYKLLAAVSDYFSLYGWYAIIIAAVFLHDK